MAVPVIYLLLDSENDKEEFSYLCELEEMGYAIIQNVSQALTRSKNQDALIIICKKTHRELEELYKTLEPRQRFVTITKEHKSLFPSAELYNDYFEKGGITFFQDNWKEYAFQRFLTQYEKTNGHADDIEVDNSSPITFYKGNKSIKGFTRFLSKTRAFCWLLEEVPRDALTFSLKLKPELIAHGACFIEDDAVIEHLGVRYVTVIFTEFDGVSREILNHFMSDSLSLQLTQVEGSKNTNKEYAKYITDSLGIFETKVKFTCKFNFGKYADGYEMAQFPWITNLLFRWITSLMVDPQYKIGDENLALTFTLKENREKRLCLYLSVPLGNKIEIDATNEDILINKTPLGRLVSKDDIDVLDSQNLMLEQYTEESHEHLAVVLEVK